MTLTLNAVVGICALVIALSFGCTYWFVNRKLDKETKKRAQIAAEIKRQEEKQIELRKKQDALAGQKLEVINVIEQLRKAMDEQATK